MWRGKGISRGFPELLYHLGAGSGVNSERAFLIDERLSSAGLFPARKTSSRKTSFSCGFTNSIYFANRSYIISEVFKTLFRRNFAHDGAYPALKTFAHGHSREI